MFYKAEQFEGIVALETHWTVIKQELDQLPSSAFLTYPEKHLLDGQQGWDIFGLYFLGVRIDLNCDLCPKTAKLLQAIPGMLTAGFSLLQPGAHIIPHAGKSISVLRCHLGLIVPPKCGLRVGPDIRPWVAGECLVFDDTFEHEAWNLSSFSRVVLLLDFRAPEGFFSKLKLPTSQ